MPLVAYVIMFAMIASTVITIVYITTIWPRKQSKLVTFFFDYKPGVVYEKIAGKTVAEARKALDMPADQFRLRLMGQVHGIDEDYVLEPYDGIMVSKGTPATATSLSVNASGISSGRIASAHSRLSGIHPVPGHTVASWQAGPWQSNTRHSYSISYTQPKSPEERQREDPSWQSQNPESAMGYVYGLRLFTTPEYYPDPHLRLRYLVGGYGARWYSARQNGRCKPHIGDRGASLAYSKHEVPHPDPCKCGINMYKFHHTIEGNYSLDNLVNYIRERHNNSHAIVALTQGWGRVAEHKTGYRVQKALVTHILIQPQHYPSGLVLPNGWKDVVVHENLDSFAEACVSEAKKNALVTIPENER